MRYIKKIALLIFAAFLLSACGGPVEDNSPVVDTTAPEFIGGDPVGTVVQACSVTADFDDPLLASTITDQSFKIEGGSPVTQLTSSDGTWGLSSSSDTMALFVPLTSVILDGTYTVTLTTDIANAAGINLATEETWTFTTTAPVVCPP